MYTWKSGWTFPILASVYSVSKMLNLSKSKQFKFCLVVKADALLIRHLKRSLSVPQRLNQSTSVFQFPTEGRGTGIIPTPATPTGTHDTRTTITTRTVNTRTGDSTMTERSTMTMTRAAQSVTSTLTPQVRNYMSLQDKCPMMSLSTCTDNAEFPHFSIIHKKSGFSSNANNIPEMIVWII